ENFLRKMPFSYITLKTLSTPPLDGTADPSDAFPPVPAPYDVKDLKVGGVPFRFKCEALDPEGRLIKFSAPGVWVQGNINDPVGPTRFSSAQTKFAGYGGYRKCATEGQRVAFAPSNKTD